MPELTAEDIVTVAMAGLRSIVLEETAGNILADFKALLQVAADLDKALTTANHGPAPEPGQTATEDDLAVVEATKVYAEAENKLLFSILEYVNGIQPYLPGPAPAAGSAADWFAPKS